MNIKEINKKIFKDNLGIVWFDRKGIMKIDENRRVEIILSEDGTQDNFSSYVVRIIHKENGQITGHNFRFDDYLDPKDRIDNRHDYSGGFYIWNHSKEVIWYIAIPSEKSILNLTTAIINYIDLYK